MSTMTATLAHTAIGGNRHSSASDWASSLLAFGAGINIAIWNPEDETQNGIKALLTGHSDTVNAIKILQSRSKQIIISGSADNTIRIWAPLDSSEFEFQETQCLTDHLSSINALATLPEAGLLVSGSADAMVKVWQVQDVTAKLVQSISLKPRCLPLALAITSLSNNVTLLAVAGTTNSIQLFVNSTANQQFELQATLTGHEGWIRSLDFTRESKDDQSDVLLASASQDKYIRIWRLREDQKMVKADLNATSDISPVGKRSLSNRAHVVGNQTSKHSVTFEALLIGHEDWIYTVRWEPRNDLTETPALLSASADNSLAVWQVEIISGLWICNSRLGEISSQKGSTTATGSTGGFWAGMWHPRGHSVVSLGRTGSWRKWMLDSANNTWSQQVGISGHVQEVQGLAWSPDGAYLLTTGYDQTTRLLAEWHRDGVSTWHEISRPQIHGYDLNCIDVITRDCFITGADEKLLRVFNKPKAVDRLLAKLSGTTISDASNLPDSANIPVLGLSNKAMAIVENDELVNDAIDTDVDGREAVDPASVNHRSTLDLDQPPFEDHLARYTLWPEHEKLYGHGYEISAVATRNDGSLAATACKASSLDHAVIRLYETRDWREIKPPLSAHSLTVTSLAFSPDGTFLLSVGRDRQWAVFRRSRDDRNSYDLLTTNPKGHSRMILDCSWAPLSAGHVFATAGRDKVVKLWKIVNDKAECITVITAGTPVTAVSMCAEIKSGSLLLALGSEDGRIGLYSLEQSTLVVQEWKELDHAIMPSKAVNALRWRPMLEGRADTTPNKSFQLAVASDDFSVRIYDIS